MRMNQSINQIKSNRIESNRSIESNLRRAVYFCREPIFFKIRNANANAFGAVMAIRRVYKMAKCLLLMLR
jgi:hypothetical protein